VNKAFCKEPDDTRPPRCPRCGVEGVRVEPLTLATHVVGAAAEALGEPAYYCGTDACEAAYFDLLERVIAVGDARGLPWPKDPSGTLCACHGFTADDVDADIAEGVPTRVREVVRKAGLAEAACATRSADGRSCVARVQRHFIRRRAELGKG
jgi:bacterioferritin-associated ferredoxin